jgi:hypothetical protein
MREEERATSAYGDAEAGGRDAPPDAHGTIHDFIDAVQRADFEAWWLRRHEVDETGDRRPSAGRQAAGRAN